MGFSLQVVFPITGLSLLGQNGLFGVVDQPIPAVRPNPISRVILPECGHPISSRSFTVKASSADKTTWDAKRLWPYCAPP